MQDRKALVTGADSGIGRAAAIAYAREGADVALSYLPDEQQDAEEVAKLVEQAGRKAVLLPGDISNEAFSKKLVADAHKALGGLDILALVAGKQVAVENIADLSSEQFRKTYETNVFALHWITQAAIPFFLPVPASLPPLLYKLTSPALTCWIMPPPRQLSLPTLGRWQNRLQRKASAQTAWHRGLSGRRCRYAVGSLKTSFRHSVSRRL